ncbi:bis(5'-nucleosyl)-tetraphosphatase (symmetrical) YqeK [Alkalihalobacterium chitinilyticum]|uniref:bis(5'-nucleosyl)-tetraphosphatase (symmetrical) n=1 Tax=Alkalihalobacterium chitinilyticum TaxID=2980103 RepID=A0ABT5VEI8_9BACI|nr:bis(5'-nucleosyl)-tetraphosphatase (symmetrical) YqeK [Alkalihalobacterium chitinilyticum]MDE5413844.1 bis(5'-nucleosyl)-tetraphosphatase (symmetrical) YqeK [Alkalihalobacterium chitinilyticum]
MERAQALEIVKPHLTEHRYIHTIGVMETAIQLAEQEGIDQKKAELASVFHDYAKFRPKEEMRQLIKEQNLGMDFLHYGDELLHAPCGAYWVKHEVGIDDVEVLSAIRYHTTGKPGMTTLEKVVFLADYIEPGRHFPGVEEVREAAAKDMNYACIMSLRNTMTFLMKKDHLVYPDTLAAYNHLVTEWKK